MFWPPTELALTEAFARGDVDVEGDLAAAAEIAVSLAERLRSPRRLARLAAILLQLPGGPPRTGTAAFPMTTTGADGRVGRRHSRTRDAAAIRRHYDVGNDFYGLWLDAERVYSCAYFPTGGEDIDTAQRAKLDLLCRKLRLRPGERLLDIGCGWGGLVRYAARHHGVDALGITLSPAQAEYATARIAGEGLAGRCRVEVRDYRDLPTDAAFDKVASVGMFEHVGRAQLPAYFRAALRLTRPGGLFLNHGIVSLVDARDRDAESPPRRLWGKGKFMDRYVFPDGELVPIAEALAAAEGAGLETRDVESLREHYALTLRHWVRRLEAGADDAVRLVGAATYRVWRLYMAASAHAFATAQIGVVQMLFARPDAAGRCCLPRTRADLFTSASVERHRRR
jgi:cyclopropane-fatty-acyl-phospholipid synthase